jgi:hypothetical protein
VTGNTNQDKSSSHRDGLEMAWVNCAAGIPWQTLRQKPRAESKVKPNVAAFDGSRIYL